VALLFSRGLGITIASIGTLIGLCALLSPTALYAAISRLFTWTGFVLSRGVTWVAMVTLFYGVFLPYGKLFRRGRRDRLERYSEPEAPSYWKTRQPTRTGSHERLY
jgi:formate-dependent nitrite reductase membrane component NrfD